MVYSLNDSVNVMGVLHMDKEEILKRSRKENENGDEFERITQDRIMIIGDKSIALVLLIAGSLALLDLIKGSIYIGKIEIPFVNFCLFAVFLGNGIQSYLKFKCFRKRKNLLWALYYLILLCLIIYLILR